MPSTATSSARCTPVDCRNTLAMPAIIAITAPTNRNFCRPDRSRLTTVASDAIAKKIAAVPPKAVMISVPPFLKPRMAASRRDSIRPMKKVKPSSAATPTAECLVFSTRNIRPKAPTKNRIMLAPVPIAARKPVATPIQAPRTVGIRESASSA